MQISNTPFAQESRDRLARIETKLDAFATKEDLARAEGTIRADFHKEMTVQTWRIIGAMLTFGSMLTAIVYFVSRNVH